MLEIKYTKILQLLQTCNLNRLNDPAFTKLPIGSLTPQLTSMDLIIIILEKCQKESENE